MDTESGESVQASERSAAGPPRKCKKCGTSIQQGDAFCSKCGADAPPPPLTFDTLPESWKKAAVGLLGITVLGVIISAFWPSGEPAVPEEPEQEALAATSTTAPARPFVPRPTRRPAPVQQQSSSPTGKWNVRVESSPLDDIKTIFLDLKATDSPEARGTSAFAPQMSFMCTGKDVEGYVFIRSTPEVDRSGYATVRVRFDSLEPQTLRMEPSVKKDALFFAKPAVMLKQMFGHERMLFGYTPQGSEEVVTGFDLQGVEEAVKPVVEGCDVPDLAPQQDPPSDAKSQTKR